MTNSDNLLKPDGHDKQGPYFKKSKVQTLVLKRIVNNDTYFTTRAKKMESDTKLAIEKTEKVTQVFSNTIDTLIQKESEIASSVKKVSGSIRQSADKLGAGLHNMQKIADFEKLERYVELLERAESAINSLASLESSGRLDSIAKALR